MYWVKIEVKIPYNGLAINPVFNYCHGPILGKYRVLKFSDLDCFFYNSCKTDYSEKYKGK